MYLSSHSDLFIAAQFNIINGGEWWFLMGGLRHKFLRIQSLHGRQSVPQTQSLRWTQSLSVQSSQVDKWCRVKQNPKSQANKNLTSTSFTSSFSFFRCIWSKVFFRQRPSDGSISRCFFRRHMLTLEKHFSVLPVVMQKREWSGYPNQNRSGL